MGIVCAGVRRGLRKLPPRLGVLLFLVALAGISLANGAAHADDLAACSPNCGALPAGVVVDPASYKLWPSGARTLIDDTWSPNDSVGVIALLNTSASASPAFTLSVRVENHDPIGEAILSGTSLTYDVPALDPGQNLSLGVPLDYTQCDIYLVVAAGSAAPTVLRTGDPAAC